MDPIKRPHSDHVELKPLDKYAAVVAIIMIYIMGQLIRSASGLKVKIIKFHTYFSSSIEYSNPIFFLRATRPS